MQSAEGLTEEPLPPSFSSCMDWQDREGQTNGQLTALCREHLPCLGTFPLRANDYCSSWNGARMSLLSPRAKARYQPFLPPHDMKPRLMFAVESVGRMGQATIGGFQSKRPSQNPVFPYFPLRSTMHLRRFSATEHYTFQGTRTSICLLIILHSMGTSLPSSNQHERAGHSNLAG
ncbi:hypothetical protein K505DRAFT_47352 [Melanomma pulvis-pyrius CBS 109.77]|uniref:Uncharacterized protein n=1 Tax=Melanomma pulvis-pyrius CBS 109.77 TaxID=1314802 RepID=A0A6A6XTA7_9PLEO|nr:hypothetical protein K505DRAFT_47352 [Melanomma pulvis-pyrius CBS 109.77]